MNTEEFRQLIQQPEGVILEFKQELYHIGHPDKNVRNMQWDEFIKDILSLANGNIGTTHENGYLIIGVEDKTKKLYDVGDIDTNELSQQLLAKLRSACQPKFPNICCELIELEGVRVLVLTIPPTPYLYETTRRLQTTPTTYYNEKSVFIRSGDSICLAGHTEAVLISAEKQRLLFQHPTESYNVQKNNSNVIFGDVTGGIHHSNIAGHDVIQNVTILNSPDISTLLTTEYQDELAHARDLLNGYKPQEAVEYLEKLKKRIWDTAQPIIRYGILRNLGTAKILQGQFQDAANFFIEALQYNFEDEKALCNVALGHLLLEQLEEANTFAKKALVKNPANRNAYSLLLQTLPDTENIEKLIAMVPEPYRMTPEVGLALGILARKRKQAVEAKKWLEIAMQHDTKQQPELQGELGSVLLELVIASEKCLNGLQLTDEQKAQLEQAIELFDSALSRTTHAERWDFRLGWLANRGLAKRFLGDLEGAIQDTESFLEVNPSHSGFIRRRAMLAYDTSDAEKAITLLRSILSVEEPPDIPLLLAFILRSTERASEAVEVLHELLNRHIDEHLQEKAQRELLESYLALRDFEKAKEISEAMRASNPTDVLNFVDAAEIAAVSGDRDDALSLLQEAKQYLAPFSPVQQQLELANAFYALKEFEDAARVYEYFVDASLHTRLAYRLLMSYYHTGEMDKALTVCQTLRQRYGILENIADIEATIYEEIGDLPKAKRIARKYLALFPEHFGMKLLVAVVNSRTGKVEELDQFLRSATYADVEMLPWEFGIRLAQLYTERNQYRRAIEILYELRRKFSEQSSIHLKYIQAFLLVKENEHNDWLLPTRVSIGTAVCLQRPSGESEWYFIVDRQNTDILRKEFSREHPIAQKLLDKKIGDEVVLKESMYSKESTKITEIKSKYIYALHESLDTFETLFPEVPGLWMVDGTDEEKSEKILDAVTSHHEAYLDLGRWYNQGRFPLGTVASLIGRNVIGVWADFTTKADVGIKCCFGVHEERDAALSILKDTPTLVIDIIALLTLHYLQAGDVIVNAYGKLGVVQTTVDLLHHAIGRRQGMESEGFSTLGKEREQFVLEKVSSEKVQQEIVYFERLRDWIGDNCEVLPCHATLHVKRARKEELEEVIGEAFVDTILLATEPGNILYSDDKHLRALAKSEHDVDGVWTQVLLMNCINNNLLEKERYHEIVIKLVCAHYYHTSINADILTEAAKQADWSPSEPYMTVVQVLCGGSADEDLSLIVGTNFLFELWKQDIWKQQPEHRNALIYSLLKTITIARNSDRILQKLKAHVKGRFKFLPFEEREILSLIDLWKQTHIM